VLWVGALLCKEPRLAFCAVGHGVHGQSHASQESIMRRCIQQRLGCYTHNPELCSTGCSMPVLASVLMRLPIYTSRLASELVGPATGHLPPRWSVVHTLEGRKSL